MKKFLFKQAVKFDYGKSQRKFFKLGTHEVPAEIEKLDYFQLLKKHGHIVEGGAAPAPTSSPKKPEQKEPPKTEEKGQADESEVGGSDSSDDGDASDSSSGEMSESELDEATKPESEKQEKKNRKSKR